MSEIAQASEDINLDGATVANETLLDGLNPPQLQVVTSSSNSAMLVLSGAGTGKTKVVTTRIAYIINNFFALPYQILALTFSNKAANEMKERIHELIGDNGNDIWMGTFHSICGRILRKHAELVGLNSDFTILDEDDQVKLAKQILDGQGRDKKLAKSVIDNISIAKDRCINIEMSSKFNREDIEFYKIYQNTLQKYNSVDFSDLILSVIKIFSTHQDVLDYYRKKFRYILVDEYQDTNMSQYTLLRQLSPKGQGLCCVGDDDQSIYSWRGAEIANILRFENDFPGANIFRLEQNYRSTKHILSVADALISHNSTRHEKHLWTKKKDGNKVIVAYLDNGYNEVEYVGRQICNIKKLNDFLTLNRVAILVRAGYQTRLFEDAFLQCNISYRVIGGPKFYERAEVKDILAYMRLVHQLDDGLAFERIVNQPKRGLGDSVLKKLRELAQINSVSLFSAANYAVEHHTLRKAAENSLSNFIKMVRAWKDKDYSPSILAKVIVEDTKYIEALPGKGVEKESRKDNVNELINALEAYDDLGVFLEHISLVADGQVANSEDSVNILTLHSSKGLEFDVVFMCGMEEGIFPSGMSLREGDVEEERRLAYVGITRAKKLLFMTCAKNRNMYGSWQENRPSRFLNELPKEHIMEIKKCNF